MQDNDASRIIAVVDSRIKRSTGSMATTETTWAEVCGISADGKYASAYLYGDTENPSEDFRVPMDLAVNVGDKVKVAWNARGERWVYDMAIASDYKKVTINPGTGEILTGDGTAPPATPVSLEGHDHDADYEALGHEHTEFTGDLTVPRLRITAEDDASATSTLHGLQIGTDPNQNIAIDGNEIQARENGVAATLNLQAAGGRVALGTSTLLKSGGTSFPASPNGGDRFYRTDRNLEYYYETATTPDLWLTVNEYYVTFTPGLVAHATDNRYASGVVGEFMATPLPKANVAGIVIQRWDNMFYDQSDNNNPKHWSIDLYAWTAGGSTGRLLFASTFGLARNSWRLANIGSDQLTWGSAGAHLSGAYDRLTINVSPANGAGPAYFHSAIGFRLVG